VKPALSGGIPLPSGRALTPRDIDAMAIGASLTHDLPLAEVRARIEAALSRGERVLEFP
jgi:hypothetical protein